MAATSVDICNKALSLIGARGYLTALADKSREAEECTLWYDHVVDMVQQAAWWPELRTSANLTIAATRNFNLGWTALDPIPGYHYLFQLPVDFLRARYLESYARFELGHYAGAAPPETTLYLSTDLKNPILVYSRKDLLVDRWSPQMVEAVTATLAAYLVKPLKGDDRESAQYFQKAQYLVQKARAQETPNLQMLESLPPTLQARGHLIKTYNSYYYPVGAFKAGGAL